MNFCENCNHLTEDTRCTICGKKKLRAVQDNDFCYFTTLPVNDAAIFEATLKEAEIPVASLDVPGLGRVRLSGQFKIFLPFGYFGQAKEIYQNIFGTNK